MILTTKQYIQGIIFINLIIFCIPIHAFALDCEWEWSYPRPQGENLYSVWEFSASDIFVGGFRETILHFDGFEWSVMSIRKDQNIIDLWGLTSTELYALGQSYMGGPPSVHYYDGLSWTVMSFFGYGSLYSIWGFSSSDIYAVGTERRTSTFDAQILHYNGRTWQEMVTDIIDATFYGVWGSSPGDVYSVGEIYDAGMKDYVGTIYHYYGITWTQVYVETTNSEVSCVWGSSPTDVFAGGSDTCAKMLYYDGVTWTCTGVFPEYEHVDNIWGYGSDDVFAIMDNSILHYNGMAWTEIRDNTSFSYPGIHGLSSTDTFIVGEYGDILHYDGITWSSMIRTLGIPKTQPHELYDVWGPDKEEIYIVGQWGTFLYWDGSTYGLLPNPSATVDDSLTSIWGTSSTDYYITANNRGRLYAQVLRYDGTAWTEIFYEAGASLYSIWGTSPSDIFIAGERILYHYNGSTWTDKHFHGRLTQFLNIWGLSSTDVYAAGYNDGIYHFDGTTWSIMTAQPSVNDVVDIWGVSPDNLYTTVETGMFRYDGSTWTFFKWWVSSPYNYIWGTSNTNIFVLKGWMGDVLHYDGITWKFVFSGVNKMKFFRIWGTTSNNMFILGDLATIFRLSCSPEISATKPGGIAVLIVGLPLIIMIMRNRLNRLRTKKQSSPWS